MAEQQKKSKSEKIYRNWKLMGNIQEHKLESNECYFLMTLAKYANKKDLTCFPGKGTLARDMKVDERTIRRIRERLVTQDYIEKTKYGSDFKYKIKMENLPKEEDAKIQE